MMAHMVETMAYAGEVPWHGLGTKVPADLTPEQMLEAAGLDWEVEKVDLTYGDNQIVPGKKGLVRSSDGKYLDTIGDDWNPLQNRDAFEFFNDFVQAGDMEMHTAGSLEDGRRTWALAKVKDAFELFKGDVTENYLLFSNPHKYGMSIDVRMTPIRVVCNNTITMALNGVSDQMVKIHHRNEFDANLVKEMLGVAKEKLETYKEAAQFLGSKKFTNDSIVEYFNSLFPASKIDEDKPLADQISRTAKQAIETLDTQPGAEFGAGTWWQAFNTVTYMTDHTLGRSADTRLKSAWFGYNRKRKIAALETAIEFAEAA
jgi:phage/plasmid-like protein (TIGR03299 family)